METFKQFDYPFDLDMKPLFVEHITGLTTALENHIIRVGRGIDANTIRADDTKETILNSLVSKFPIEPLHVDLRKEAIKKRYFIDATGIFFMFYVPYQGNASLFDYGISNQVVENPVMGSLMLPDWLMFQVGTQKRDETAVLSTVDKVLAEIDRNLSGQKPFIEEFNNSIPKVCSGILDEIMSRHNDDNDFIARIGFDDLDDSDCPILGDHPPINRDTTSAKAYVHLIRPNR